MDALSKILRKAYKLKANYLPEWKWRLRSQNSPVYLLPSNKYDDSNNKMLLCTRNNLTLTNKIPGIPSSCCILFPKKCPRYKKTPSLSRHSNPNPLPPDIRTFGRHWSYVFIRGQTNSFLEIYLKKNPFNLSLEDEKKTFLKLFSQTSLSGLQSKIKVF